MKGFFGEFKKFALRGNAIDLAVGVVIGAAFTNITNALANNILTPPLGLLLGGAKFSEWGVPLDKSGQVVLQYGLFIQAVINFMLMALALFFLVKGINYLTRIARREQDSEPQLQESKTPELVVLEEIRDSLRK